MIHFVINQVGPGHSAYRDGAEVFTVTSGDLEHEFSGPMSEDDARTLASALNACQTMSDRWERGECDLAEAARLCAAVVADVTGRVT